MTIAQDHGFSYSPSESSPDTNPGSMLYDDDLKDSFFDDNQKPMLGLKSASLASRKGSGPDAADKRATHNAIERARRESLNGRFMTLAEALPSMSNVKRPSKSNIVNKALDFVYDAQIKEHKLIEENNMLRREVDQLRARLGMAPLPPPQPLLPPPEVRDKKAKQQKLLQKQQLAEAAAAALAASQQQQQQAQAQAQVNSNANNNETTGMFSTSFQQREEVASLSGSSFSSPSSVHSASPNEHNTAVDNSQMSIALPAQQPQQQQYHSPSPPLETISSSSPSSATVPILTPLVTSSAGNSSPFLAQAALHSSSAVNNPFAQQQHQAFLQAQAAQSFGTGGNNNGGFMSPSLLSHQQSLMFAAQAAQFQHQANQFHGMELYGAGMGMMGGGEFGGNPWGGNGGGYSPFSPFVMS